MVRVTKQRHWLDRAFVPEYLSEMRIADRKNRED